MKASSSPWNRPDSDNLDKLVPLVYQALDIHEFAEAILVEPSRFDQFAPYRDTPEAAAGPIEGLDVVFHSATDAEHFVRIMQAGDSEEENREHGLEYSSFLAHAFNDCLPQFGWAWRITPIMVPGLMMSVGIPSEDDSWEMLSRLLRPRK